MQRTKDASWPKTARDIGIMQGFPPPPEKRPNLKNWDLAPFNRWSFQNIRSMFPTVEVRRGSGPVWEFGEREQDLSRIAFSAFDGRKLTVRDWIGQSYTDGFLVLHGDQIVTEFYDNDMQAGTLHLGQSLSKSLVGTLAGIVHDQGALDLQKPLAKIVPELVESGYADCTVEQALDMTSGVRFVEDYNVPESDMTRLDIASGWRPVRPGEIKPTIRDVIVTLRREREHGQLFSYRSIETDVIAWVLERVSGMDLASLLSEEIWQKLGCEKDAFFTVDDAGTALADGGFNATLRDYARFGKMVMDGGRVGTDQVVPQSWIEGFFSGADKEKFGSPYTDLSPDGAYRRFWWVHDADREVFMARGVFGQLIFIDRMAGVLLVKLSSWPDYLIPSFGQDAVKACKAIIAHLSEN